MSDIDLQYQLMMEGRMNLMHLPPGAIAWLWDRPAKQVQAAEDLAVAANSSGNPVVDASLLKADQNILLIKCEGGECFRVYPDGGYSYHETPMDIGGCSAILMGGGEYECPTDDLGHADEPENDANENYGNYEHMDRKAPEPGVAAPRGMTNLAGEPTVDEDIGGDWGGPGTSHGMGTGTPYVGDLDLDYAAEELDYLAKAAGVEGILVEVTRKD